MIATGNHYFERFAALCNTPGGSQGGWYEFALGFHNGILRTAGNPSGAMRRPQLRIKQLYAVEDGYTC